MLSEMQETLASLLPWCIIFGLWIGSVMGSSMIARNRGYSPWMYGWIGFVLGPGGILLTLVATRQRRPDLNALKILYQVLFVGASVRESRSLIADILSHETRLELIKAIKAGPQGAEEILSDTVSIKAPEIEQFISCHFPRLLALFERARSSDQIPPLYDNLIRYLKAEERIEFWRSLVVVIMAALFGGLASLFFILIVTYIPHFAEFFEGMNLTLPLSTKILLYVSKSLHAPFVYPLTWLIFQIMPAAVYFFVSESFGSSRSIRWRIGEKRDLFTFLNNLKLAIVSGFNPPEAFIFACQSAPSLFKTAASERDDNSGEHLKIGDMVAGYSPVSGYVSSTLNMAEGEGRLNSALSLLCDELEDETIKAYWKIKASLLIISIILVVLLIIMTLNGISSPFYCIMGPLH